MFDRNKIIKIHDNKLICEVCNTVDIKVSDLENFNKETVEKYKLKGFCSCGIAKRFKQFNFLKSNKNPYCELGNNPISKEKVLNFKKELNYCGGYSSIGGYLYTDIFFETDTKFCKKCKEEKELSEFGKRVSNKGGLRYTCKHCESSINIEYNRTKEGKLKTIYDNQVQNSKRRGHETPKYTKQEFVDRFINNEDYLLLYNKWVESGYEKMLCPSFDRLDDYKPYSFDNLNKWMTWEDNYNKGNLDRKNGVNNKGSKSVIGTNILTGEVFEFYSTHEAERRGFHNAHIGACCRGKQKTHKGYTWEYKK